MVTGMSCHIVAGIDLAAVEIQVYGHELQNNSPR